jgi:Brp/Blh family beta-carotene 15,15'-monooxygenase
LKNIQLILTFFTLWLSIFFDQILEDYTAYFSILTLGILHGANDIGIGKKTLNQKGFFSSKWFLLVTYVSSIILVALLLYGIPGITLALFILLSAFHFGEQHWNSLILKQDIFIKAFMMLYGLLIFSLLFRAHSELVIKIIRDITSISITEKFLDGLFLLSLVGSILTYIFKLRYEFKASFAFEQLFYLLIFYVVFNSTTLLWAFAIYFIFWHSLPSLLDQMFFLYGNRSFSAFLKFLKASYLYWFLAVISLVLYYFVLQKYLVLELSMFFAFLTALTIPHIFLMYFLKNSKD